MLEKLPTHTIGVIYAGGVGSRLWPISTEKLPKQVNPLFSRQTLIVDAYTRALQIFPKEHILVAVTEGIYPKVQRLLNLPKRNYIIQPETVDTAAAMALVALYVEVLFPDATAVTFYADQAILDPNAYKNTIESVIKECNIKRGLYTIGTNPTYASTDFGYITLGKKIGPHLFLSKSFIEKPDIQTASKLYRSGATVWNTGTYIWQVREILHLLKIHTPDIYKSLLDLRSEFFGVDTQDTIRTWHANVRRVSFDIAVSQKMRNLYVYVANFNWTDIGNWAAVYDIADKDTHGHVILHNLGSRIISIDSKNCLIVPRQQTISLIGIEDVIIVQTEHELLICKKDQASKVKYVVKKFDE